MENGMLRDPGCGAAVAERCERAKPYLCARHEWRMAALTLVRWAESRGEFTGGRRTQVIDERLALVLDARGCRLAFARLAVAKGVTLADAVAHLVAEVDGTGLPPQAPAVRARLDGLGDLHAVGAATRAFLLGAWRTQPRQSW